MSLQAFAVHVLEGGVLRARGTDGLLIVQPDDVSANARDIVLFRPTSRPDVGFIAAVGNGTLELGMEGDRLRSPVLSYRLGRQGGPDITTLRNPLAERYACAAPARLSPLHAVVLDRTEIGGWEMLRLVACQSPVLPPAVSAALRSIEPALGAGTNAEALIEWLAEAPAECLATVGMSLLRLAPPDTIALVAAAILRTPELAVRLAAACPSSPWLRHLPDLRRWLTHRSGLASIKAGPEFDHVVTAVTEAGPVPDPALHLLAEVRRLIKPRRRLAIVATARNEGPYFVDWIAYHRAIGIEHFFIYSSDDNDDGSDGLLSCLAENGVITYILNTTERPVSRQEKAYNHALLCVPELLDYRWTAIIDLDEYIVVDPERFASLDAFLDLQESRGADAVSLNWRLFGSDARSIYSDDPLIERIVGRAPDLNPFVKAITRTNRIWGSTPHTPIWPERTFGLAVDSWGKPHFSRGLIGGPGSQRHSQDPGPAWINHYYSKSFPECVWKFARSSSMATSGHELRFSNVFIAGFVGDFGSPRQVEDRTILVHADAAAAERAVLMAIPGIAAAHAATVGLFCEKVTALVRDIPNHAHEIPEPVRDTYLALVARSLAEGVAIARPPFTTR